MSVPADQGPGQRRCTDTFQLRRHRQCFSNPSEPWGESVPPGAFLAGVPEEVTAEGVTAVPASLQTPWLSGTGLLPRHPLEGVGASCGSMVIPVSVW